MDLRDRQKTLKMEKKEDYDMIYKDKLNAFRIKILIEQLQLQNYFFLMK